MVFIVNLVNRKTDEPFNVIQMVLLLENQYDFCFIYKIILSLIKIHTHTVKNILNHYTLVVIYHPLSKHRLNLDLNLRLKPTNENILERIKEINERWNHRSRHFPIIIIEENPTIFIVDFMLITSWIILQIEGVVPLVTILMYNTFYNKIQK